MYNPRPLCCFDIKLEYFYLCRDIDKSIGKLKAVCLKTAKSKVLFSPAGEALMVI